MSFFSDLFSAIPELKTDIGSDLEIVIDKKLPTIGMTILISVVLAILIAHFIIKRSG